MRKLAFTLAAALLVTGFACSSNDNGGALEPTEAPAVSDAPTVTVKVADSSKGKILTDDAGLSLYTFDNDADGKPSCVGGCASTWPALTFSGSGAPSGTTGLATVTRSDDSSKQVTYNGKPLYTYSGDEKAGDTNGDGIGGKWHVAKAA